MVNIFMKKKNCIEIVLISLISIISWIYLLGLENINLTNTYWLKNGDLSQYQIGWNFFRTDDWRFPIGLNPNYGIYLGSNIILSDSIPILALIFKSLKFFLPQSFQYFSIWILVCIFLQLYFSFKIINYYTKNFYYSLLGSLFFLLSIPFIHRSAFHLSLMAHWLILGYFYYSLFEENKKIELYKCFLILLSLLIHFYFFIILSIIYILNKIFKIMINPSLFSKYFKNFFILYSLSFLIMYIVGYFSIGLDDGLGGGYGNFNFNLSSFFNPLGSTHNDTFSWSAFFEKFNFYNSGEQEGTSYLGISGLFFFVLFLSFFFQKNRIIIFSKKELFTIFFVFFILATSHNVNFGPNRLITLELNKYIYLLLSIIRASGRLIWPVFYLILIVGLVTLYKIDNKKISLTIITILLCVHILEIFSGLKFYKKGIQYSSSFSNLEINQYLIDISNDFDELRHVDVSNQSSLYYDLTSTLQSGNFKKTDIVYLARVDRNNIVQERYNLYEEFLEGKKNIFDNKIFLTKNENSLKSLFYVYNNYIYYHFIDNIWLISNEKIKKIEGYQKALSQDLYFNFDKKFLGKELIKNDQLYGFGWDLISEKNPHSDGYISQIFLKPSKETCNESKTLHIKLKNFYPSQIDNFIKILLNQEIIYSNNLKDVANIKIPFSKNLCASNQILKIDFIFQNPKSLFDNLSGLNRTKRSIILESLIIS